MEIETRAISGTYDEVVDAAEGLGDILNAAAAGLLDLAPVVERWLVGQLEQIELALARQLEPGERPTADGPPVSASAGLVPSRSAR